MAFDFGKSRVNQCRHHEARFNTQRSFTISTSYKMRTIFASKMFFQISVDKNFVLALQVVNFGVNQGWPNFFDHNLLKKYFAFEDRIP